MKHIELILKLIEIPALMLLIYTLLFVRERLMIDLFIIFSLLVVTGSVWFVKLNFVEKLIPSEFKDYFLKIILYGSILLFILAIYMVFFYV